MPRKARSHRLRFGRVSEHGRIYLVTAVCADRKAWFSKFEHGRCCVRAMRELEGEANTLCFVVMPDHMHWMMQLEAGTLSRVVQKVKGSTTRRIGQLSGRPCKVWQPGFHDRALRREEELQAVARYVVANPLRAGLVSNLRHYPLWDAIWL
ncbi:transposase [Thioalkalivibrio sp. ALRh]|uniref:REP-associated tyrosine transposase n=1 Tax=Thioalkalivibrio sp. ALRh TaxID=1266911 RepID=UPI00035C4BCE|nr:transposase [Thioalkalivibrio sp. ALRh]